MNTNNLNFKYHFQQINIIFLSLLAAQVIYFVIVYFLISTGNLITNAEFDIILMFIIPVIVLSGILAAKYIYTKIISDFDKNLSIDRKIISYRNASIIRLALIEGANIFTITAMFITGNYLYSAYFIILIVFYVMFRPSKEKFVVEYEVSGEDVTKILL